MAKTEQFNLPDVGEGLTEAEIATWKVQVGDTVEVNQVLVEIETAKSLVELPSPHAGIVAELHAAEGETVDVGLPIISITTGTPAVDTGANSSAGGESDAPQEPDQTDVVEPQLLVGYGARKTTGRRRRARRTATVPTSTSSAASAPAPPDEVKDGPVGPPRTKPPVRKLAKTLGVDLTTIRGSGPHGLITRADVTAASKSPAEDPESSPAPTASGFEASRSSGEDIRIPIKGVRKHTAAAMVTSAFTAPHVTEFVTLDVTATMDLRNQIACRSEFHDIKLSPLTFIARAFLRAMKRTPSSNSRWDESAQEIVQMRQINLGIAAATPRGLVVPNIKDAQDLSLAELAVAIAHLATTARAGRTTPEDMARGTATISNFGVFGVDTGTPILNPGETAILGVGTISRQPWVVGEGANERIEPRWVTTLALSFDHRVMDGQQGSELLADTATFLRDPALSVL